MESVIAMTHYEQLQQNLRANPRTWLVTGAAGFIGSHLVETLLRLGQRVTGFDNFATGRRENLVEIERDLGAENWARFRFVEGDIRDPAQCQSACAGMDYVLHQAALGSVPRSIERPQDTHSANVDGFVNMLIAARDAGVKRFVYASSSSVYGDSPVLPKSEANIGQPLSPYAASKWINEIYAGVFARSYGLPVVGLRYFNVFGPRQDPDGPYAAVIPRWMAALQRGENIAIFGDGETSRDFCYVANAVQANLLAAASAGGEAVGEAFNVAVSGRTSLNELFALLKEKLVARGAAPATAIAEYRDFRAGDVRHSQADISKAGRLLGYAPTHSISLGLEMTVAWAVPQSPR